MLDDIKKDSEQKMTKSIESLKVNLLKIRTGRAHPSILEGIKVDYYGAESLLSKISSIKVEDVRTLSITVWEKDMVIVIEKTIRNSDLGLNPMVSGSTIRVAMPPLNEERRLDLIKLVKNEVEHARISIRNIRRDANSKTKELLKKKEISEDDEKTINDFIQKITDLYINNADIILKDKEIDLMQL